MAAERGVLGAGVLGLLLLATPAAAAEHLHGAHIRLYEGLPFAGLLLSIALGPIVAKRLWHVHYGWAAAAWAVLALGLLVSSEGFGPTLTAFVHSMLADYLPFILMLFALYTAAGGIVVSELNRARPITNVALLATGTLAASVIGTTGASMILIRPLLQANANRRHQVHVVVFFIFLVSNIGGILSPLGDPPLFFGFLRGIDFFWPLQRLWPHMLVSVGILLFVFFLLDLALGQAEKKTKLKKLGEDGARKENPGSSALSDFDSRLEEPEQNDDQSTHADLSPPVKAEIVEGAPAARPEAELRLSIRGLPNFLLIAFTVAVILMSAVWRPGIAFDVAGVPLALQNLTRDACLLAIGLISLAITPREDREANHFAWEPLVEVAKLFAAIFVTIIPVMAMLAANSKGPFAPLIASLAHADGQPNNVAYFWAAGLLSSFLDNAPTYLVFFGMAGGDPVTLMGPLVKTLEAISLGAVFMGALTYIGNAPNFMVYAMARRARVNMPGFFGYMLWSAAILLPVFALVTIVFLA